MKIPRPLLPWLLVIVLLSAPGWAQRTGRDPLNRAEVDQLRDTNQEPEKRLRLIVKFARARLDTALLDRADPKMAPGDKPDKIHDALQDFLSIYDEMGDNLDMYVDQKADLRKPLKEVVAADGEFRVKLDKLRQDSSGDDMKTYGFLISNALEAVNDGTAEHRKLQQEQELASHQKKKDKS